MAAYFVFEDNVPHTRYAVADGDDDNPGMVWHVGDAMPVPPTTRGYSTPQVIEVQADGDELEHIRRSFDNVPNSPDLRVLRWFGDMARFIYHNMPPAERG